MSPSGSSSKSIKTKVANSRPPAKTSRASPPLPPPTHGFTLYVIFEPSKIEIVKSVVPKYLNTQVWKYLLESFASEQAARMMAMENATENAKEMINDLNLEFNKARQTAITTEMLEIVGGAEALSN